MACLWTRSALEQKVGVQNARVAPISPWPLAFQALMASAPSLLPHCSFLQLPLAPGTLEPSSSRTHPPPPNFPTFA